MDISLFSIVSLVGLIVLCIMGIIIDLVSQQTYTVFDDAVKFIFIIFFAPLLYFIFSMMNMIFGPFNNANLFYDTVSVFQSFVYLGLTIYVGARVFSFLQIRLVEKQVT